MSKSTPSSVTAEEAVARIVNMDYIPEGFSLEDMLAAFSEEAEVNYENARIEHQSASQIEGLRIRAEATKARETLARLLLKAIQDEGRRTQDAMVIHSQDNSTEVRYKLESIAEWAAYQYGIGIPEWYLESPKSTASKDVPTDVTWDKMEVRIRKGNKLAYSYKKGKWSEKPFHEIKLLDRKMQEPNYLAGILIGLSIGKKFPPSRTPDNKHKTAITRLRNSLKTLTGVESDPFMRFNITDGWKPRFKLKDDRRNADNRAKKAALHEEYDESNFEDENDATGDWLKENK